MDHTKRMQPPNVGTWAKIVISADHDIGAIEHQ
jgi:hypothetical protein